MMNIYIDLSYKLVGMMRTTVTIRNLKCDSCKNALKIKLSKIKGISNVDISVSKSSVSFDYMTHNVMEGLRTEFKRDGVSYYRRSKYNSK